jgi:hypothetical protein
MKKGYWNAKTPVCLVIQSKRWLYDLLPWHLKNHEEFRYVTNNFEGTISCSMLYIGIATYLFYIKINKIIDIVEQQ